MGDTQVGGGSYTEAGDSVTETGDAQVDGGTRVGEGAMAGLCESGWDNGGGSGDRIQGFR